jgi:catechol 2,3-dioxygenase-like lactoylglutathione lyase family enzyme
MGATTGSAATAPAARERPWRVTGPRHAGITVSDLDRSLRFYRDLLGLELLWRRVYDEPEIRDIVGVPEATSFDIAMLRIPGSEVDVELLQYHGVPSVSGASPPSFSGTGHVCLFVDDATAAHDALTAAGVRFRSPGPVEMTGGSNRGGKSMYALDPDGYVIELHERPPQAAARGRTPA